VRRSNSAETLGYHKSKEKREQEKSFTTMTKGTFFALAEFRAGTEIASPAALLESHMVSTCCLAVLISSTDWQ